MSDPTTHLPITREPRRLRPPYDVPDNTFDDLMVSDADAWRRALRLDRLAALAEPLAGLAVTDYEHGRLEHLAEDETHVVAVLANLLWRCREAPVGEVPAPDPADAPGREVGRPPRDGAHPVRLALLLDVFALLGVYGYRRPDGARSTADSLRALNALAQAFEAGR